MDQGNPPSAAVSRCQEKLQHEKNQQKQTGRGRDHGGAGYGTWPTSIQGCALRGLIRRLGKINTTVGPGLAAAAPIPDLVRRFQSLQLHGTCHLQENASLRLSLLDHKLSTDDRAWDSVNPGTVANVLSTGQFSPNYSVNVIGLTMNYTW